MATRELSRRSRRSEEEDVDEYQEEEPRRGRSRRSYDDDDEAPRGRRSSRRDDDDEDEAPRGRRGRSRDDDEDQEPPRGRRSRSRDEDDDEPPRGRRSRRSDDDEGGSRRGGSKVIRNVGKGWGDFKSRRVRSGGDFEDQYKYPEKQEEIVKVFEDQPFAVVNEHWLDDMPKGKRKGYLCLGKDDCPICLRLGHKPKTYCYFNVIDMREGEEPVLKYWKVAPMIADILEDYNVSERTGPINRDDLYFSVRKTGGDKKGRVQVNVNPVKARDLEEDWGFKPFTSSELDEFDLFEQDDVLQFDTVQALRDVVDYLD